MKKTDNYNYSIRHWREDDLKEVQSIAHQTWQATYKDIIPASNLEAYHKEQYSLKKLKQKYQNHIGFVAVMDDMVVGYSLAVVLKNLNRYQITSMYVLPDYQGYHIGTGLLKRQMNTARERGYNFLWLGVIDQNKPSLLWYEKQGFSFIEDELFNFADYPVKLKIGRIPVN